MHSIVTYCYVPTNKHREETGAGTMYIYIYARERHNPGMLGNENYCKTFFLLWPYYHGKMFFTQVKFKYFKKN